MTKHRNTGTASGDESPLDQDTRWRQVTQRLYESERDDGLTTTIVFAIAEAKDVPPTELKSPPLYDVVDVSAIENAFFGSKTKTGSRQPTGTVEFRYADYLVKVRSDGWVQVSEAIGADRV